MSRTLYESVRGLPPGELAHMATNELHVCATLSALGHAHADLHRAAAAVYAAAARAQLGAGQDGPELEGRLP